jgi:hypothetical protein
LIASQKKIFFLEGKTRAFTFAKNIQKGQYVLPFSFKLPEDLPGSMNSVVKENGKNNCESVC